MKKKDQRKGSALKRIAGAGAILCALYGWWGAVYPQYSLFEDTYNLVFEGGDDREAWAELSDREIGCRIMNAAPEQIQFKLRLLEWFR